MYLFDCNHLISDQSHSPRPPFSALWCDVATGVQSEGLIGWRAAKTGERPLQLINQTSQWAYGLAARNKPADQNARMCSIIIIV